ncbi:MAG: major facilitator superfamily 1 [Actinoallomurus sp.]|jgi:FSR family fosmidomycin resistance protein-like MFS transporter|nr:major facilitator superfamily 1 [Actinoallomurus sp.]
MTSGIRRRALALLIGTHVVDDLYQGAVPALLPFLVAERHYGYAQAAGITLAATFLSSLLQPGFGVLTDRRRRPWLIGAGLLTAGVGIGLCGLGGGYWATWAAVALSGMGVAAYHPEASAAARSAAGASAQGMSLFAVGGNAGIALAPLIVAPVLATTGLIGTPLLAIPAVAMALYLAVAQREPAPARVRATPTPQGDDWRSFGRLTVAVVCRSIAYFGVSSFLALLLIHRFGVSKGTASVALTVFTGTGAAGTVLGGRLADRIGRLPTVRIGYVLTVPGLLGLLLAPGPAVAFVAAFVLGLGLYVPFSVHTTLGQEYLPGRIGTASGVTLGLAVSAGGMVAPLLGLVADAYGIRAAIALLLVLPVMALAVSARLPETRVPLETTG